MAMAETTEAVTSFSDALADIEQKIARLQRLPWNQLCGPETAPLDSARMHLMIAYAVNALFWMYLRARGEKVAGHPVKAELERVKKALRRVKEAEAKQIADEDAAIAAGALAERPKARVDALAARRFVTAALAGDAGTSAVASAAADSPGADGADDAAARRGHGSSLATEYSAAAQSSAAAAQESSSLHAQSLRGQLTKSLRDLERASSAAGATDESVPGMTAEDATAARELSATIAEHTAHLEEVEAAEKADADAAAEADAVDDADTPEASADPPGAPPGEAKGGPEKKKRRAAGGKKKKERAAERAAADAGGGKRAKTGDE